MRTAGLVYVAYFALSIAGSATKDLPLQLVSTGVYFGLAVVLYRLFAAADPRAALALLPLAALGCVIQGMGQLGSDAALLRLALVPFALFLVVLGYLVARSSVAPTALGILIAAAGIAWCFVIIPGIPSWYGAVALFLGIVGEGALAIWLLVPLGRIGGARR
jgi:hypothetical protein